jgi:hypothetical protein
MKGVRNVLFSLTVGFAVLAPPWTYLGSRHIGAAYADVLVNGTVILARVYPPAAAWVRILGVCSGGPSNSTIWIKISPGDLTELNSLNMKNAYSTLLTALISGRPVEISGMPSCSPNPNGELTLNLPNGYVVLFQ